MTLVTALFLPNLLTGARNEAWSSSGLIHWPVAVATMTATNPVTMVILTTQCIAPGTVAFAGGRDRTRQNLERVDNEPPNLGGSSDLLIEVDRERARTGIRHGGLHKHSSPFS
jgi:hypothetical protein